MIRFIQSATKDYRDIWNNKTVGRNVGWLIIGLESCYCFFVICFWREPILFPTVLIPFFLCFFFVLLAKFYKACCFLKLRSPVDKEEKYSIWMITLILFISYLCMIAIARTIGTADTRDQWEQVQTGRFDDWHPVIHTFSIFVLYKLLRVYSLVVMAFIALFCYANAWLYSTLRGYGYKKKWCALVLGFICLSPLTLTHLRVLWKDTEFGIAILYLSVFLIHIWHDSGRKLRWWQWIVFAFLLVYASFVRHNGFFFTIPILFFLPWNSLQKSKKLCFVLFSFITFTCIMGYVGLRSVLMTKGVIYQKHTQQSFSEAVGLPMCIMSRVMVCSPEKMPREALDFMLKICPLDDWNRFYDGSFNSVKFKTHPKSTEVFLEITPADFARLFVRTVKASPYNSINALASISSLGIDPFFDCFVYKQYSFSNYDYAFLMGILTLKTWVWLFISPGLTVLLMIVLGGYAFFKHGCRVFLLISPYIAYTWGTTLLLTGWDLRFFYGIIIGGIPIILVLLGSHQDIPDS